MSYSLVNDSPVNYFPGELFHGELFPGELFPGELFPGELFPSEFVGGTIQEPSRNHVAAQQAMWFLRFDGAHTVTN